MLEMWELKYINYFMLNLCKCSMNMYFLNKDFSGVMLLQDGCERSIQNERSATTPGASVCNWKLIKPPSVDEQFVADFQKLLIIFVMN
jgi:hypothetical protein